eukprot:symbB.v1.2.038693.t1/scaffold6127.1/size20752/1
MRGVPSSAPAQKPVWLPAGQREGARPVRFLGAMPASQYICDISKSGNLLEFGLDPFYRPADSKSLGVQTEFKDSPQLLQEEDDGSSEMVSRPAAASQILRFAVGWGVGSTLQGTPFYRPVDEMLTLET